VKAAVYKKYGPPEVVQIAEIPKPVPKENEILIQVHTATVNRTDCGFRSAEYVISRLFSGLWNPKLPVLGNEFCGEISAIGKNVKLFKTGDRVFGYNDKTFGAHAEYLLMDENAAVATVPENLDFATCAALTEGAHYALRDIRAAKITGGQNIMVYGATGAIGSAAVQILKAMGNFVVAVCNSQNVELIRALGVDIVVDYQKEDFTKLQHRFHFIFDSVGKTSFGACKPLLLEKGIYISTELGKNWQNIFLALITPLFGGKKVLFPIPTCTKDDILYIKDLAEKGKFKPLIDSEYPLENIVEAYKHAESGTKVGNILLHVKAEE